MLDVLGLAAIAQRAIRTDADQRTRHHDEGDGADVLGDLHPGLRWGFDAGRGQGRDGPGDVVGRGGRGGGRGGVHGVLLWTSRGELNRGPDRGPRGDISP